MLASLSTALANPLMVHVGPLSALVDPSMAFIIPLQTSQSITGSQLSGLSIALSIASPKFMEPPVFASPAMSTV